MSDVYLHYGDADHPPMLTIKFTGTARELLMELIECRREGWPLRITEDCPAGCDCERCRPELYT